MWVRNVFQDFDRLLEGGDRFFDSLGWPSFAGKGLRGGRRFPELTGEYPRVNVRDEGGVYTFDAQVPGLDEKALSVSVNDRTLTLSGERNVSEEVQADKYLIAERSTGRFTRSYTLPSRIHQEGVKAEYKDGHLRITVPKAESSKPKAIEVHVSN